MLRSRFPAGFFGVLFAIALTAPCAALGAPAPSGAAADGPGALSHFDLARKDCLGTARDRRSKVWFTVAGGMLSDVYFPTEDNTNVETMEYVVARDGAVDLQARDMTYTVRALDDRALSCRVTVTGPDARYRITTDYVTDPARPTVLMRTRFEPLRGHRADYRLYVRLDPSLNGNGGGGAGNGGADSADVATADGHTLLVGSDTTTATNAANRDYAVPVHSALDASRPFLRVSNGFAGAPSDGLSQLTAHGDLQDGFATAAGGNTVQTAQLDLRHGGPVVLGLGFGDGRGAAIAAVRSSLDADFGDVRATYEHQWNAYDRSLHRPARPRGADPQRWGRITDEYYLSANTVKAAEDKTFPGAVGAALASPWGQAISAGDPANTYFGSYREVFARDLYEAWSGLMTAGDKATARDMTLFLFERQQQPDGSMPRNSLMNGRAAPDTFGTQLDECSYPILMALANGLTDGPFYAAHIRPAADFVMAHGPSFGSERWEEQGGFSPSTMAAEIAGLVAAAHIADLNGDTHSAALWRGVADQWQRSLKKWTLTTNGSASPDPYFIRLSKTGDPDAAISYNVGNGGPTLDQRAVIDQGFLEYVRLGVLPISDPDVARSLDVVDATIRHPTASGAGFLRYNGDGYGDGASDGHPWAPSDKGTGHVWPVLAGERGQYEVASGAAGQALDRLDAMRSMASGVGLIPEQAWDVPDLAASPFGTDPTVASIGFRNGGPAGSAAPLTWSSGQFVRLVRTVEEGRLLDRPAETVARYVTNGPPGTTPLTITAPADESSVGASVTVAGTTAPGNTVDVAATNLDQNSATTTTRTTAAGDGSFSADLTLTGGTSVITVVATTPSGATAADSRTVVFDFTPGTSLLDVTDPAGDDNGPGNYAYPTSDNFKPGAYDIRRFQVFDAGDTVIFKLTLTDLTPTFGSPLGAQLVDVYVHDPAAAAADTSTQASFPQRRYSIAPAGAWSRLLEVQGFGQRYIDAHGTTLGQVTIGANRVSRAITFSVPKASLGQPGQGWGFAVVLTGQDGFSPDQARGFQPTPEPFQFGVCATASADPHCTADPSTVPKAVDIITPPGVSQSTALDYTLGAVAIPSVTIP